ncbi:hypothetical protein [Microbacterium rhizophilus]|uniref:hypothetical protein n=1 Tax=Microbacterium rhizophilus TaxID=3138934 RepID=UPI0031ECA01F
MSITITATPDTERRAVSLVVDAGTPGSTLVSLRRTDANGAADVRLPILPSTFEAFTVDDHEAALTGPIEYEATIVTGAEEVLRENLVKSPRGATTANTDGYGVGGLGELGASPATGHAGTDEATMTWTTAAAGGGATFGFGRPGQQDITVESGSTITASLYVRVSQTRDVFPILRFFNASGQGVGLDVQGTAFTAMPPDQLTRMSVTAIVPAGATRVRIGARIPNLAGIGSGFSLRISAAVAERGDHLLPYFDGSTPLPGTWARWTGAANASSSQLYIPAGTEQRASAVVSFDALDPFTWILHPAVVPEDAVRVTFADWSMSRTSHSTQSDVIDRPDPIVNRGPLGMRSGSLEAWCEDYTAVRALEAIAAAEETVMLRQIPFPGLDGYFEIRSVAPRIERATARPGRVRWTVTLGLVEVQRPSGPLLAAPLWTYGAILAEHGTYRGIRDSFETYRDLLLNRETA